MNYPKAKKEKICRNIRKNGYALLKDIYSEKEIDRVKNSLVRMLNYIKPNSKIKNLQEKYYMSRIIKCYNMINFDIRIYLQYTCFLNL